MDKVNLLPCQQHVLNNIKMIATDPFDEMFVASHVAHCDIIDCVAKYNITKAQVSEIEGMHDTHIETMVASCLIDHICSDCTMLDKYNKNLEDNINERIKQFTSMGRTFNCIDNDDVSR